MADDAGGAITGAEGNPTELVVLLFPEAMVVGNRTKSELIAVNGEEVSTKGLLQRLPLLLKEDGLGTF